MNFDIKTEILPDDNPDLSWLGEFSNDPGPNAIDHHATGRWLSRSFQGPRWFNPPNDEYGQQDYERLRDYHIGYWSMVGVVVTASFEGIELGSASLWGIESDSEDYLNEVAKELTEDAITVAKSRAEKILAALS